MKLVVLAVDNNVNDSIIKEACVAFSMTAHTNVGVNILTEEDFKPQKEDPTAARRKEVIRDILGMCKAGPDIKTVFWQLVATNKITPKMIEDLVSNGVQTRAALKEYDSLKLWDLLKAASKITNFL